MILVKSSASYRLSSNQRHDMKKLFAAALVLLLCLLVAVSCSAKSYPNESADSASQEIELQFYPPSDTSGSTYSKYSDEIGFNYSSDTDSFSSAYTDEEESSEENTGAEISDAVAQRKIIYSSFFGIQTTEFDKTLSALDMLCEKYGAYYEKSDVYGSAEKVSRNGSFTVRVPVENYKKFRDEAGTIGTVVHSSENNEDVTEKYFDTEARLTSAKLREERLLEILKSAESLDNVLLLEKELADVRYEIESLSGTLRKYDSLVSYSIITLEIEEVLKPVTVNTMPKTFGERISQAVSGGFEDFADAFENMVVVLSYNLPTIIALVILAIAVLILVKVIIKKSKRKSIPVPTQKDIGDSSEENKQ